MESSTNRFGEILADGDPHFHLRAIINAPKIGRFRGVVRSGTPPLNSSGFENPTRTLRSIASARRVGIRLLLNLVGVVNPARPVGGLGATGLTIARSRVFYWGQVLIFRVAAKNTGWGDICAPPTDPSRKQREKERYPYRERAH